MRTSMPRRRPVQFACLAFVCFLPTCAGPRGAPCRGDAAPATSAAQPVTLVDPPLSAVRDDFNAHAAQWRAVLLVSPTCSECILGARAVEREVMARYPAQNVHATVVWVRMLGGDCEDTARASSGLIARPNSIHFYDDAQAAGRAYARGPYADMGPRAKASLPPGHWLLEDWPGHKEDAPQWDLYMLYAPGVKWAGAPGAPGAPTMGAPPPPMPTAWIRHLGRRRSGQSVYWRDTPDKPPREGDLFDAMRAMADETMGKPADQPGAGTPAPTAAPRIELLAFPGCPNTPAMRAHLAAALAAIGRGWAFTETNQEALPPGDIRRGYPSPTILINDRDLYGLPIPAAPSTACRTYPGGVPDSKDIAGKINATVAR